MSSLKNAHPKFYPFVSIIILNYNGAKFIKNCLSSLSKITYPNYEIIFVDNCSVDDSLKLVTLEFKHILNLKIIKLNKNFGYAAGNNFGSKYINKESKYLLFLNIDTEVTKDFLEPLVRSMEDNPLTGAVQPKLILMQKRTRIDSMGAFIDVIGMVHNMGGFDEDLGQYDTPIEIFYAKGAALLTRRELFEKTGKFDQDTFLFRDEVDLCWKIWLTGYRITNVPCSTVYHYGSAIIGKKFSDLKMDYFFVRNNIALLLKNYSLNNAIRYLYIFMCYRFLITTYYAIIKKDIAYFKYFYDSIKWNMVNLRITLSKRSYVQFNLRKIKDQQLIGRIIYQRPLFIKLIKRRLS